MSLKFHFHRLMAPGLLSSVTPRTRGREFCIVALFASLTILPGFADSPSATPSQTGAPAQPAPPNHPAQSAAPETAGNFLTDVSRSNTLLGDIGGLRPFLGRFGMTLTIQETSEVLGNVTGGARQGFEYDGLTQIALQLDTDRAFGLHGGTFNISALQIHGRDLSAENLDTLQTASGIEADRATRLWELWYQQKFLREDRMDIKIGLQSVDQEFIVSQNALLFVNTAFGWPITPTVGLPAGGPAYPLSALGARLRWHPLDSLTLMAGVFNGAPAADLNGDAQMVNASGLSFPLHGGLLAIGELQYSCPPGSGVYKLGFYYDSGVFADQEIDNAGLPLASPASTGIPRDHRGDYALYAVADQTLWSAASAGDAGRTINFFARAIGAPEQQRNLIDIGVNSGFTFHEPIPGRSADTLGLGIGYARVSGAVSDSDRQAGFFGGGYYPVRGSEEFVELTYQYQLTPWCQLQPDFQYVFNPGAGILNPYSGKLIKNEAVLGIRVNVQF